MRKNWRRYEVMLPLQFNDGSEIPVELRSEAVLDIALHFGGASYEAQSVEGHWIHNGTHYRDNHAKLVIDLPETVKNRRWMKAFKARWKERLQQLELWMVSYRIEVE
ncbi:MAG: hypothetical protein K2R98_06095 [Gemmataceae bacterium]|nr:hypothetical protein [Gemmataceae bacterium]